MSLFGVMRTGVSGMSAQSNKLSTVSDNIANVNTTGYKRASTEFSSLILKSGSGNYDSGAVETTVRYAITDPGNLQFTTSTTDLAVQGNGFFVVQDTSGQQLPDARRRVRARQPGQPRQCCRLQAHGLQHPERCHSHRRRQRLLRSPGRQRQPDDAPGIGVDQGDSGCQSGSELQLPVRRPASPLNYTSKTSMVTYDNIGNACDARRLHEEYWREYLGYPDLRSSSDAACADWLHHVHL